MDLDKGGSRVLLSELSMAIADNFFASLGGERLGETRRALRFALGTRRPFLRGPSIRARQFASFVENEGLRGDEVRNRDGKLCCSKV